MLKWTVLVLPYVDDIEKIHAIYGIFFHYIDFETLVCFSLPDVDLSMQRPQLCQLLYLLTRRQDGSRCFPFSVVSPLKSSHFAFVAC